MSAENQRIPWCGEKPLTSGVRKDWDQEMNLNHREAELEGSLGITQWTPNSTDGRWRQDKTGDGPRSSKVTQDVELCPLLPC